MAFDLQGFIERFRPIEPTGSSPTAQAGAKVALSIIQLLLEYSVYIFLIVLLFSGMIYLFALGNESQLQTAKKSFVFSFVGFLIVTASFGLLQLIVSQLTFLEGLTGVPTGTAAGRLIGRVFTLSFIAAGVGFLMIFLFAGTRYMFSLGNEDEATTARRQVIQALIGLALTLGAYAIGRIVIDRVGFLK